MTAFSFLLFLLSFGHTKQCLGIIPDSVLGTIWGIKNHAVSSAFKTNALNTVFYISGLTPGFLVFNQHRDYSGKIPVAEPH